MSILITMFATSFSGRVITQFGNKKFSGIGQAQIHQMLNSSCYKNSLLLCSSQQNPQYLLLSSYLSKISVGTPQILNVIVDTVSHLSRVDCSHNRPNFYKPANSSTASVLSCSKGPCNFSRNYKNGSKSFGYMVSDVIHFSTYLPNLSTSQLSAPVVFGLLDSSVDGILGLDQTEDTLISQLFEQRVAPKVVSHCL